MLSTCSASHPASGQHPGSINPSQLTANIEQLTSNSEQPNTPLTPQGGGHAREAGAPQDPDSWGICWDTYGKKSGKAQAIKAWNRLKRDDIIAILEQIDAYVAAHPDPQYRKDPVRFLRHRAWEDALPEKRPMTMEEARKACPHGAEGAMFYEWLMRHHPHLVDLTA
jgi:hypothetical protein